MVPLSRSLALALAILLMLPSGWCCMVPQLMAQTPSSESSSSPIPESPAKGTCPCCANRSQVTSKPGCDEPVGKSSTPPVRCAVCPDHQGLPTSEQSIHLDMAVWTLPEKLEIFSPSIVVKRELVQPAHHSPQPLNVLFCLWTC